MKNMSLWCKVLALSALVLALSALEARAQLGPAVNPEVGKYYFIQSGWGSGKCLDLEWVDYRLGWDGNCIEVWDYYNGNTQKWQLVSAGGGYYKLRNKASGKDMDVRGASLNDGAAIQQYTPGNQLNQQFALDLATTQLPVFFIRARHSGKVLDVPMFGPTPQNGWNLQQYTKNWGNNQRWSFHLAP